LRGVCAISSLRHSGWRLVLKRIKVLFSTFVKTGWIVSNETIHPVSGNLVRIALPHSHSLKQRSHRF
jgi:hypothetical protein